MSKRGVLVCNVLGISLHLALWALMGYFTESQCHVRHYLEFEVKDTIQLCRKEGVFRS